MHVGGCNINKKVLKKSKHIYVARVNAHMSTGNVMIHTCWTYLLLLYATQ